MSSWYVTGANAASSEDKEVVLTLVARIRQYRGNDFAVRAFKKTYSIRQQVDPSRT